MQGPGVVFPGGEAMKSHAEEREPLGGARTRGVGHGPRVAPPASPSERLSHHLYQGMGGGEGRMGEAASTVPTCPAALSGC